jgi:glycosyltransferase involved in cell wall biosynthesis
MRIAMIGQKTDLQEFGGVERHVALISEHLAARGHDVTIFVRRGYGRPERETGSARAAVRPCIPTKNLEAISHSSLCALESSLRGYDVIHFHAVGPCLAIPLARIRRKAIVCATVHDQDYNKGKWGGKAQWALRSGEAMACRRADVVIAVAHYLQDHLRKTHGRDALYIPNGNDPLSLAPTARALQGFGLEPGRYMLFLARLVPEKGCDTLIRALRSSDTPYKLAVVGGSSHSDRHERELHELADGDPRIRFLGFQSGQALDELRTNAAAYVMPSRQEGLPLALLEALWYGMPVIASDIPAVHEVDGAAPEDQLTLVPPGDVEALRTAIEDLPWPARESTPGRLRWPTWGEVAEEVERVYERTLARRGRRR